MRISLTVIADRDNHKKSGIKKYHRQGFKAVKWERGVLSKESVRFRKPSTYITICGSLHQG